MEQLSLQQIAHFQKLIYDFYQKNKRDFIWRNNISPYNIVVSEIMLQQTQTARVALKFTEWIERFPNFQSLAKASNHDILHAWQGLGYNRRGLAIGKIAQIVMTDYNGVLPNDPTVLETFPAIGKNTAGSICAFAFNNPTTFIETNIRTVFTHTFFKDQDGIDDKQLLPLIAQTVDKNNARDWYYALMDYGVHLKKNLHRINSASKHYTRQSKFEGSKRQIRGMVLKILTAVKTIDDETLVEMINLEVKNNPHDRMAIIQNLIDENIVQRDDKNMLSL